MLPRLSRRLRCRVLCQVPLGLGVLLATASAAHAGGLIKSSGPIDRPTNHTVYWCSSRFAGYWDGEFTANGPEVTIVFSAKIQKTGPWPGWMDQRIDNVALVEKTVFQAHVAVINHPLIPCALQSPQEALLFQQTPPGQLLLFDAFHNSIGPGWDLSDLAHLVSPNDPGVFSPSAENDLLNPVGGGNATGRSLGLGRMTDTPPDNLASTRITVGGLQDGKEYVLNFWWKSDNDNVSPDDYDDLQVDILGTDPPANVACSTHKLTASDPAPQDDDGYAVDIDGQVVLAGAPTDDQRTAANTGAAYLYQLSGTGWYQLQKLFASDFGANDQFGHSVSMQPTRVVVGAWLDDDHGLESGSAYVFDASGGVFSQAAKLLAPDGAAGDVSGSSVAVFGDRAVVGAPRHDHVGSDAGAAYVFLRQPNGSWTLERELVASDPGAFDRFGESVAFDKDVIVVGAPGADGTGVAAGPGAAYVFRFIGGAWGEEQKLIPPTPKPGDSFGQSVAVSGDRIVVGAPYADDSGDDSGRAHVYHSGGVGPFWSEQPLLLAPDGVAADHFGTSVAVDTDAIVIGARHDDPVGSASGSAYVFRFNGGQWGEAYKFIAPDAAETDELGVAVAVDGDVAVAGSHLDDLSPASTDAGSVYVFGAGGDCNHNLMPDLCDIWSGGSLDVNENGIPDECEVTASDAVPGRAGPVALRVSPNPFNPRTAITFDLPRPQAQVELRVYDPRGALVRTLVAGARAAGVGQIVWDGRDGAGHDAPSGAYLVELVAGDLRTTAKLTLVR